jgi:anti-sigma factor RsiW
VVKTAGFQGRYPKYLPDGFTPIAGDVSDIKGIRTLHLLYSDGLRTLSLFENSRGAAVDLSRYKAVDTRFEDHNAQLVEDGPTRLLAWEESGLHFALVGELGRTELQHIAASVVP